MRVCDRHPRKKATDLIHIESTDSYYDLCPKCAQQVEHFMANRKLETVEKRSLIDRLKEPKLVAGEP